MPPARTTPLSQGIVTAVVVPACCQGGSFFSIGVGCCGWWGQAFALAELLDNQAQVKAMALIIGSLRVATGCSADNYENLITRYALVTVHTSNGAHIKRDERRRAARSLASVLDLPRCRPRFARLLWVALEGDWLCVLLDFAACADVVCCAALRRCHRSCS